MSILQKLPQIPVPRLARFFAVIAIAMAAGHLVQTLALRKPAAKIVVAISTPQDIVQLSAGSGAESVTVLPPSAKPMEFVMVASSESVLEQTPVAVVVAENCPIDLALDAGLEATVRIVLLAPCHAAERVVLRHAGLAITAKLAADGSLITALPAFVREARVEVLFADGNTVEGVLDMAEAATLRRFGVQWQGAEAFVVHGLENGADYGQPGDVSPANPGKPEGGSLAVLGDSTVDMPLLAQIYTFPADRGQTAEVVIEAAVTEATCGHDLLAETIASGAGQVEITELTLAMPDCSGVGDFLVLKNLASDMKIAAN